MARRAPEASLRRTARNGRIREVAALRPAAASWSCVASGGRVLARKPPPGSGRRVRRGSPGTGPSAYGGVAVPRRTDSFFLATVGKRVVRLVKFGLAQRP